MFPDVMSLKSAEYAEAAALYRSGLANPIAVPPHELDASVSAVKAAHSGAAALVPEDALRAEALRLGQRVQADDARDEVGDLAWEQGSLGVRVGDPPALQPVTIETRRRRLGGVLGRLASLSKGERCTTHWRRRTRAPARRPDTDQNGDSE